MADSSTPLQTLLFIPDISGFTRFVNETEISHSQHIISELLEALVDANETGLSVSAFEGDAILFYRAGAAPTPVELLAQVQKMYVRFHEHLKVYEAFRICHCGSCSTASSLQLKFVAHYGPVGFSSVKEHATLFGREVIVAHRLMKNDVPTDEYVLLTKDLLAAFSNRVTMEDVAWYRPETVAASYDFGPIEYSYIPLGPLRELVPEPTADSFGLGAETNMLVDCQTDIDAPLDLVFDVVSDLSIRHVWMVGLKGSDELNSRITRNGSTHRCVIKNNSSDPRMVSHSFEVSRDVIAFTETQHRIGVDTVFTLRRIDANQTSLTVRFFMKRSFAKELFVKLFLRRTLTANLVKSLAQLRSHCEQLVERGTPHPARIVLSTSN